MKKNIIKKNILNNYETSFNEIIKRINLEPDSVINNLENLLLKIDIHIKNENIQITKSIIKLICKINYYIIICYLNISEFDKIIEKVDTIKKLYSEYKIEKDLIYYNTLMSKGILISEIGDPINGIKIFKNILNKISKKNFIDLKLSLYINIAELYKLLQINKKALIFYKKGLILAKILKDNNKLIILYENISLLYYKINKLKLSKIFAFKGLKICKLIQNNQEKKIIFYRILSLIYLKNNNIEKAKLLIRKAIFSAKNNNIENYILILLVKLTLFGKELKIYFDEIENYKKNIKDKDIDNNYLLKLKNQFNEKKIKIIKLSNYIKKIIKRNNLSKILPEFYKISSEIYENIKDFKKAFTFYSYFIKLENKLKKEVIKKNKEFKEKKLKILKDLKEKELYYLKYNRFIKLNNKLKKLHSKRKKEIKIIQKIYKNLILPDIPFIPGIHIYTNFKAGKDLSGDFYYFQLVSPTMISIFLADVCGHGIYPSFCTILLKMFFNLYYNKKDNDLLLTPEKIMQNINNFIIRSINLNNYITAFYCLIDLEKRIISYSSAGHAPQIIYIDGNINLLKPNSPFIGLKEDLTFNSSFINFNENSCLLLFTDGIIEYKLKNGKFFNIKSLINYFFAEEEFNLNINEENYKIKKEINLEDIKNKTNNIFNFLNSLSKLSKKYKNSVNTNQIEKDDSTIISIIFK